MFKKISYKECNFFVDTTTTRTVMFEYSIQYNIVNTYKKLPIFEVYSLFKDIFPFTHSAKESL